MKPETCIGCPCHHMGNDFTAIDKGDRYESTRWLLVGEASGEGEARDGLPFRPWAQAGSLLADSMREMQISRSEMAITNCLRCRPKNDWLEGAPYAHAALNQCVNSNLKDAIQELRPKVILAIGGTAMRWLSHVPKGKYGNLDYARGFVYPGGGVADGILTIPTYHSAHLRRGAPELTPLLQRDLRRAFMLATGRMIEGQHYALSIESYGPQYQPRPTLDEALEWESRIDPSLPIIYDIETTDSAKTDEDDRTSHETKTIRLVQFTQHRKRGIALPFRDEFVEIIRRVLALPNDKAGHNSFAFDNPILEANGMVINGELHDTMILYGYWWSDLPRNLQSCAQMAGFPMPWKALGDEDLEIYGCFDVDATLCVYHYMRGLLEREGMWQSYKRYFAQVWPILRSMSQRGIPISETKRLELKQLIQREDQRVTVEIQGVVPEGVKGHTKPLKRTPKSTEGMIQVEVGIEKEEKCQCLKRNRSECPICAGSGIVPAGTVLKRWALPMEFNPNSPQQVKRLIKFLRHPIPKHPKRTDEQGEAAETTEIKELERLWQKTKHPIYPMLIEKRQLTKVDGTYADGWAPSADGSVHTTYTFQTATWQTSSRAPNVQNGLKHGKSPFQKDLALAFNAMQRASSGRILINLDFKSFHALTTAHDFNIPDYARLARIDIHSFVTGYFLKTPDRERWWAMSDEEMRERFKELKKDETFKFTRDFKAKRAILGIQFGMGYRKLYQLNRDDFASETEARQVWEMVYHLFPKLRKSQDEVRQRAAEDKRLVNKFGAIRHLFDVVRWDRKQQKWVAGDQAEQAVAFLPASHAFGHVRDCLLKIRERGLDDKYGLCNQIHDSLLLHCPVDLDDVAVRDIRAIMETPSQTLIYPEMAPQGLVVGADAAMGVSLADMVEVK